MNYSGQEDEIKFHLDPSLRIDTFELNTESERFWNIRVRDSYTKRFRCSSVFEEFMELQREFFALEKVFHGCCALIRRADATLNLPERSTIALTI